MAVSPAVILEGWPGWAKLTTPQRTETVPVDVEQVDGVDRTWEQMPGFMERDGDFYCALTYPISNLANSSGSHAFSSDDLRAVIAAGIELILPSDIPPAEDPTP